MNLKINGNPGSGNNYDNIRMNSVGSYTHHASYTNNISNYHGETENRLTSWFRKLKAEYDNNIVLQKKLDDIKRYRTKLPHTIGLEQKLKDGGFMPSHIDRARRLKLYYAKKSTKFQYYESAQRIDSYLFAKVCSSFDSCIMPMIEDGKPLADIRRAIYTQVVQPIMEDINAYGADDECLCYNEDDIFGMIYYLTGNCHINWKNYDE